MAASVKGRAREALLRALLAGAAAGAALLAVELALRAAGYVPRWYHASARLVDPRWNVLLDFYPSNPRGYFDVDLRAPESRERYFHLAPHRYEAVAARVPYAVMVEYNSLRFRDAEPGPRPAGVHRVVIVGDSFTEGQGVKEPDTCARVLERLVNAGGGSGRCEIAAVAGWTSPSSTRKRSRMRSSTPPTWSSTPWCSTTPTARPISRPARAT